MVFEEGLSIGDKMGKEMPTTPKDSHILDNYLTHASLCEDAECLIRACKRMKYCFEHVHECHLVIYCDTCHDLIDDIAHHVKSCRAEACPVFLCEQVKKIQSEIARNDQECMEDDVEDGLLDSSDETDSKPSISDFPPHKPYFVSVPRPRMEKKIFGYFILSDRYERKAELYIAEDASSSDIQHDDPRASTPPLQKKQRKI
ncbi:hypothetical protein TNIN_380431 [Trichonephila inaurata madagascariensis]|uniref:TAZ-type domain-containing protein n=1 Tax=Trichonephila inaurata madagascariensis TaxID=2747483 RepID=A0A8X6X546_9ARAC|nr:hypothetical protein TNIN_380431 [Trichonephila inaurata madagascariensis]